MTSPRRQRRNQATEPAVRGEEIQSRLEMTGPAGGFERHALSFAYPEMTSATGLNGLVVSMRTYGYDPALPIVIFEGAVLDGWNRYKAAQIADVEPIFSEFVGTFEQARDFVRRHNSFRRHLPMDRQCYAIRATEITLPPEQQHTPDEIADIVGTTKAVAEKAFRMHRDHPEMAKQVVEGKVSAETAEIQVGLKSANSTSRPATILAVTSNRIISRFNSACEAEPGKRMGIRPKTAINELVNMWCQAREEGRTLVIAERILGR